jgi:L-threonylcarbamoyladenylate synthase
LPVRVVKISRESPDSSVIDYAAELITSGEVVGVPTDTFYGLSADPFNLSAVERVYSIKGRPETKALPILVNSVEQAVELARELPDNFLRLAGKFWPGALTLVVEATHRIPFKVTGNTGRVAMRWADSKVTTEIIDRVGGPITGTSANLSGSPACTNADDLVKQLGERLNFILDSGETGATLASTIVRLEGDEWSVVRDGAIPAEEISLALS